MIRRIYIIVFVLTFFSVIKSMELEEVARNSTPSLLELLEKAEPVLAGVAHTIDHVDLVACQNQLIALKHVMCSVIDGLEIKDEQLVIPGVISSVPLSTASEWIQAAFHLAEKKHDEGSVFVTSDNCTIKECQTMLEKLWRFGICLDLLHVDQKEAERLYSNRMIRIGALLNYTDPIKQNVNLLKEYAKIQVLQVLSILQPTHLSNQHEVIAAAFEQSAIHVSSHAKKREKKIGCFTRCVSKNKMQEECK